MTDAYVTDADPTCKARGCQLYAAHNYLVQARQVIEQQGRSSMSQALWCDQGGHAFSERDPGRQRISVTVLDDNGDEQQEARDLCGECAQLAGLLSKRKTKTVPAISAADQAAAAEAADDHMMLRDLQRQINDLRAQRDAALAGHDQPA